MDLSSSEPEESGSHCRFQTNGSRNRSRNRIGRPFQIIATTLLSLLLPLCFLLLGRLSTANYLLSATDGYLPSPPYTAADDSFLTSFFLSHAKTPTILHLLVSAVSVSTLAHALTGRITVVGESLLQRQRPICLSAAWICLCAVQICVGLGIEGSIAAGIEGSGFGKENSALCRAIFFLGLHETAVWWWRAVVKRVVDDTVFGERREERWEEKAAIGAGCGWLWWWRVKEEVESLVVVPEVRRELVMGVGAADFIGWWLYYLTVTIGMIRVIKGFVSAVVILTRGRERGEGRSNDDKV